MNAYLFKPLAESSLPAGGLKRPGQISTPGALEPEEEQCLPLLEGKAFWRQAADVEEVDMKYGGNGPLLAAYDSREELWTLLNTFCESHLILT